VVLVEYPDRLEIKKCTEMDTALDILSRFIPNGKKLNELDLTLRGSEYFIEEFLKRMNGADKRAVTKNVKKKRSAARSRKIG